VPLIGRCDTLLQFAHSNWAPAFAGEDGFEARAHFLLAILYTCRARRSPFVLSEVEAPWPLVPFDFAQGERR
jgi:hypothetical protein